MRNFSRKSQEIFFKWSWSLNFLVTKYPLANDSEFHQILNLKLLFECIPKVHSSSCILQSLFCNEPINIKLEEKLKIWKRNIISVVFSTDIFPSEILICADFRAKLTIRPIFEQFSEPERSISTIFGYFFDLVIFGLKYIHLAHYRTIFGYFEHKKLIIRFFG